MKSWNPVNITSLPGKAPVVQLWNTATKRVEPAAGHDGVAGLYVCGITPYDATHMGHASTYIAFDSLKRIWLDAGLDVTYVQNVTDVDDPLLERATATGVSWQDLALDQEALFAADMTALRVIPPKHYLGVVETIHLVVAKVQQLVKLGYAYTVPTPDAVAGEDVYFDVAKTGKLGHVSGYDEQQMATFFAARGGDPDRAGKRNALDPLLWRVEREGEPAWDGQSLGKGRPGWHIECACIALEYLPVPFAVQGGGSDLIFPHHEMSALHAEVLSEAQEFAALYMHTGMVAYQGEKMSKSLGNLVFVSKLLQQGVDARAIRLALLAHHYRTDWEWTDAVLETAQQRLATWQQAVALPGVQEEQLLHEVRLALTQDLDTPAALLSIDRWAEARLKTHRGEGFDAGRAGLVTQLVDTLLGIAL